MDEKGNIILYTTPDGVSKIEVTLQNETVWLTLDQMAQLFQRNKSTISRHIKNIFEIGELNKELVDAFFATTTQHGAIQGKTQTHFESLRPEGASSLKALGNALWIARKGTTALKGQKHISQITNSCVFRNSSILNKNHVAISL